MNKILSTLIFLSVLLFGSCKYNPQSKSEVAPLKGKEVSVLQEKVNFDIFFEQFQKDSLFQLDRISFPLKKEFYNTDKEFFDKMLIKKEEWAYTDFSLLSREYLKELTRLSENKYSYNIQIVDTGISVNYIFEIQDGKWYLVEIQDESM